MALRRMPDGSIISANVLLNNAPSDASKYRNFGIQKAMVLRANHPDSSKNRGKKSIEYDLVIVSGSRKGEIIRHVHPTDAFGGKDNFNETVYQPKTKVLKGKDMGDKTPPENCDGSYVLVCPIDGHYGSWNILGGIRNPNNPATDHGSVSADGTVMHGKFNKLSWNINKDGKMTIDHSGTKIELDDTGNVNITAVNGITFDGQSLKVGDAGANQSMVLGDNMAALFNNHTHSGSPVPDQQMVSGVHLSPKTKVS